MNRMKKEASKKAAGGSVPPAMYASGGHIESGSTEKVMNGHAGAKHTGTDSTASVMRGKAGAKR